MTGTNLSAADRELIDELAAVLIPMGMTPIEARIHGLLLISPEPLTLDEMVEALSVSKSSASVAARELERHGVAVRFSERGSKRVRYGIADRAVGFLSAQVEFLGSMGNLLARRAASLPNDASAARLRGIGTFYLRVRDALASAIEEK